MISHKVGAEVAQRGFGIGDSRLARRSALCLEEKRSETRGPTSSLIFAERKFGIIHLMNIDNTELLEVLKQTQPPKPEKATGGVGEERTECVGKEE